MAYKIAIVDDDKNLLESLGYMLKSNGFSVDSYNNGEKALHGIRASSVDLVILDLCMPNISGFKLFQKLRELMPSLAVIFLTARQEDFFESSGLELGADDFIRKPWKNDILLARINARIKKPISEPSKGIQRFTEGQLEVDVDRRQCFWRGSAVPHLTKSEFKIVSFLARRAGIVRTRDQIISHVYGEGYAIQDQAIDTHKKRIVKKFKLVDEDFDQIQAEYGDGYRWKEAIRSRSIGSRAHEISMSA